MAQQKPSYHYPADEYLWFYLTDDKAKSVVLGPVSSGEPGEDWVLTFTPEDSRRVAVRMTPRVLQEIHTEAKDISPEHRQAGHTSECQWCGGQVEFSRAVPNHREEPVHRHCYQEAYGTAEWLEPSYYCEHY